MLTRRRLISVMVPVAAGGLASRPIAASPQLLVAAASNLQSALPEIIDAFHVYTGLEATVTYGSTGNFARQIRQGAPFEVFLAADERYVAELQRDGVIADAGAPYAIGRLMLIAYRAGPFGGRVSLEAVSQDLAAARPFRLAIANPDHAPYGQRAIEVLLHGRLLPAIKPRLVYAENVSQAHQFVVSGAAAIGLTSRSLPVTASIEVSDISPAWHSAMVQRLVLTKKSTPNAALFAAFMTGPQAQAILQRHGFGAP